jgi:isopenicillin N synthase-like dioxygenase
MSSAFASPRPVRADFRDIPIIDMAPLHAGSGAHAVGVQIDAAARSAGFFYVRDHGVPQALLDAVFAASREFFAMPERLKAEAAVDRLHRGYIGPGQARMYGKGKPDLKESFVWGVELPRDDPDVLAGKPLMGPNRWPPAAPELAAVLGTYHAAVCDCARVLLRGFAAALDLPPDHFQLAFAKPLARGSIIYYPPQPPDSERDRFGVAPHTDYGCLTLLAQDENGGLEVRNRAGDWVPAAPVPGTFVVNIGDLLARWTNDVYASNPHRVINRSGRARYSVALFFDPHPDTLIAPLASCVAGEAPRYPPISCGVYLGERFSEAFSYREAAAAR